MLLAIDTSTNLASVALVDATDGTPAKADLPAVAGRAGGADTTRAASDPAQPTPARLLAELTWDVGTRHSVELLERIEWLLASRGATMAQLTALAVATGPGSFNGARVAVTSAKSLAFALGLPVVALSTLDVIAYGAGPQGARWALLDAGRGEVYAAHYAPPPDATDGAALAAWGPTALADDASEDATAAHGTDAREATGPGDTSAGADDGAARDVAARYHVCTPQRLAALVARMASQAHDSTAPLLCGGWRGATQATLVGALAAQSVAPRYDTTPRRAWSLAMLALARLATQTHVITDREHLAALEPHYLRRPAITTSAKRALRS